MNSRKLSNLMSKVFECMDQGNYLFTNHVLSRMRQRDLTRIEVNYVLKNGYHEKGKDQYIEEFKAWNYSVRGKTFEERELRIVVSFDRNNMLIITAIDLNLEDVNG